MRDDERTDEKKYLTKSIRNEKAQKANNSDNS